MDWLIIPTSRRDWAILTGLVGSVVAVAVIVFGTFSGRSLLAAGVFLLAAVLAVLAVWPKRAIGIPLSVLAVSLKPLGAYVLVTP
ncbi:hypothetical protein SAMN04487820_101133 [Actinopolyspora mzabensis]|uniref:Uncharacterized protein n=1 Tax=Actinopolyspora mzabensis TaxID=995066 RepID=A0A1G8VK89_ACTMZ|nr:hypothetical protein [Actinopolyspora mzabensis]SDJ66317.1 hypothetical protein SAMN04487820_101133 [Actinopolyspora mzabensis]